MVLMEQERGRTDRNRERKKEMVSDIDRKRHTKKMEEEDEGWGEKKSKIEL